MNLGYVSPGAIFSAVKEAINAAKMWAREGTQEIVSVVCKVRPKAESDWEKA